VFHKTSSCGITDLSQTDLARNQRATIVQEMYAEEQRSFYERVAGDQQIMPEKRLAREKVADISIRMSALTQKRCKNDA
jgi:hypothetical protein